MDSPADLYALSFGKLVLCSDYYRYPPHHIVYLGLRESKYQKRLLILGTLKLL